MKKPEIHISKNQAYKLNPDRKGGKERIFSLSFPPVKTCIDDAPCTKYCYAYRSYKRYPNGAKAAWEENLKLYTVDSGEFWTQAINIMRRCHMPPALFRFFIGGDFPDAIFVRDSIRFASMFPDIKMLAFTKKYKFLPEPEKLPENYAIIISVFPDWPNIVDLRWRSKQFTNYPKAYIRIPGLPDPRIPFQARECKWNCVECQSCWNLSREDSIVFDYHTNGRKKKGVEPHNAKFRRARSNR